MYYFMNCEHNAMSKCVCLVCFVSEENVKTEVSCRKPRAKPRWFSFSLATHGSKNKEKGDSSRSCVDESKLNLECTVVTRIY